MLRLVTSKPSRIVRRAILLCEHPDLGWVVLDRSKFPRRLFGAFDECRQKNGVLIDRARTMLSKLYRFDFEEFERGHMFLLRGLTDHATECTVFRFGTMFGQVFRQLPDDRYIPVSDHPSAGELHAAVAQFERREAPKRRAFG